MGINIPQPSELIAANLSIDQIADKFGADSVAYLSVAGLHESVQIGIDRNTYTNPSHCMACLTNNYPIAIEK